MRRIDDLPQAQGELLKQWHEIGYFVQGDIRRTVERLLDRSGALDHANAPPG